MKVSLADQIEFAAVIRDSFERLVAEGVKSTNGMTMETKLDRAEAILLRLHLDAAHEPEFTAFLAKLSEGAAK